MHHYFILNMLRKHAKNMLIALLRKKFKLTTSGKQRSNNCEQKQPSRCVLRKKCSENT